MDCVGYPIKGTCLNDARAGRSLCWKCEARKYRASRALNWTYKQLKSRAKRRGIDFTLTLDQWKEFCDNTEYLKLRGSGSEDMTVDRIMPEFGYSAGNIQMLTRRENSIKQIQDRKDKYKRFPLKADPEVPF